MVSSKQFSASIATLVAAFSVIWTPNAIAFAITEGSHRTSVGVTYNAKNYLVNTVPSFVTHLTAGGTKSQRDLMAAQFPGWTFDAATGAAPGTLTIEEYDAISTPQGLPPNRGGVDFSALYDDGNATSVTTWNWIQIITSISEEVGYPYTRNPSVDPPRPTEGGIDDSLPFYFTLAELSGFSPNIQGDSIWKGKTPIPIQNPAAGGDLRFFDEPQGLLTNAYMRNDFDLFLVSWDGGNSKTVTLYDGVRWGFEVVPEPSSLLLFLIGATMLASGRRRRTHSSPPLTNQP